MPIEDDFDYKVTDIANSYIGKDIMFIKKLINEVLDG